MIHRLCLFSLVIVSGAAVAIGAGSLEPGQVHSPRPIARREPPLARSISKAEVLAGGASVASSVSTPAAADAAAGAPAGDETTGAAETNGTAGKEPHHKADPHEHAEMKGDTQTCNFDYIDGNKEHQGCLDEHKHTIITDMAVCQDAARVRGFAIMPNEIFLIEHADFSKYPRGCFRKECSPGNKTECFFYNDNDDANRVDHAAKVIGTTICTRDKFRLGGKNSNDCFDIYDRIISEKVCSDAGACLGFSPGVPFRVDEDESNLHQYDFYPQGCFEKMDDGEEKAYFNDFNKNMSAPKHVDKHDATPLCVVTTPAETLSQLRQHA